MGDFRQGEAYLERLLEVLRLTEPGPTLEHGLVAAVIPVIARITGVADRSDVAEAAAETVLSAPSVTPLVAALARFGLALLAVQRGDIGAAKKQYASFELARLGPLCGCEDSRILGLLAQTAGNLDDAAGHFEDAVAYCRKVGYRPELAWSLCDYADLLLERDAEGDRQKAMSLLDESLKISRELGMKPLMERVLSRREILKA